MSLILTLDHAQKRLGTDRIAVVASGLELDGPYFQDTWIDPVTNTLMLRPGPLYPEWFTLNTGIYAKLAPSDLTASTPANWFTVADYKLADAAAGPWIASKANAPGGLLTNTTWGKNRGFSVSAFAYGAGDNFVLMEGGWNPTPSYLASVGWRLYSGGDMEIWKNGVQVGLYNISGAITAQQQTNVGIDLMLIPCRKRELLVVSRQGNGFSHVFEDIDEDSDNPEITPASKFWVSFPSAAAQVQIAPLKFNTTGYATSLDFALSEPPTGSSTLETFTNDAFAGGSGQNFKIYGDSPYAGSPTTTTLAALVSKTNGTFTANGTNKECRIKVTITGDGNYTPFVYGAQIAYARVTENTDASEAFITLHEYAREFNLDVPDQASGVTARMVLKEPEGLEATIEKLRRIANRPIKIESDSIVWMDGQCEAPEWEQSTSDATQTVTFEIRDRWKSLENYMFRERVPLDGYKFRDALLFLIERIGLASSDTDIEDVPFYLPDVTAARAGDFNVMIEIGDTAAEWIDRLFEDYAATWHYGFEPQSSGIKFAARSPEQIESLDPLFYLYPSHADAIAAGILEVNAWKHVYRSFTEEVLECESNDIRVTGWDPRVRRIIQSHYPDLDSQDPGLAPSLRAENWLGEPRRYGLFEPAITTQDACDRAARLLFERLTPIQRVAQIQCEMMIQESGIPVWRGQDIWIEPYGRYRVRSFGVDCEKEQNGSDLWQWRPSTYVLQKV